MPDEGSEKPEEKPAPPAKKEPGPIDFAKVQAEAIVADARQEAEELREKAMAQLEAEMEELKKQAHTEGYQAGFAQGMAEGWREAKVQREQMAQEQEITQVECHFCDKKYRFTREEIRKLANQK